MAARTITIQLDDSPSVDPIEFREMAVDITKFIADQFGFERAEVTVHGRRGRGGWKTESWSCESESN